MSTLHPHWQTTDDDERPVRVTDARAAQSPPAASTPAVPRAKRGPAALIGMAVFFGIGFVLFNGITGLLGQVSSPEPVVIRLTDEGADPPVVTVRPGDLIRWDNGSTIPHILESYLLPPLEDATDDLFVTTAIFPNSSFEYAVPATIPAGTYDYASRTALEVKGQIIVDTTLAAAASSSSVAMEEQSPPPPPEEEIVETPAPVETAEPEIPAYVGGIPRNPNTVGSVNTVTLPPTQSTSAPANGVMQHRPVSATATGMEAWVTLALATVSIAYVTRKALRES